MACNMGGMGFIENNKAECMLSVLINTNLLRSCLVNKVKKYFFSSSACVYNAEKQSNTFIDGLKESDAYPAMPEDGYGWEKLFSERLYMSYARNYGIEARIARFHNIFGPRGSWNNGKEKSPAALCRKVAMCEEGGTIDVWGPGIQTRSFLFIDECVDGIQRIMASDCKIPVNLGSTRMISINNLVFLIAKLNGKNVSISNVDGPRGVMGRNSDNRLIKEMINWTPGENLEYGLLQTYNWIVTQIESNKKDY
jgi:nucleoside-diphosphate-sugar epimerase